MKLDRVFCAMSTFITHEQNLPSFPQLISIELENKPNLTHIEERSLEPNDEEGWLALQMKHRCAVTNKHSQLTVEKE